MFHFPTFPPHALYIQARVTRHHSCWVSPFGHPRISARLTAPRGISQPPTSFIGSWCQGIHHAPLNTYKHKNQFKESKLHHNKHDRPPRENAAILDARIHYPVLKHHTPSHNPTTNRSGTTTHLPVRLGRRKHGPVLSEPNSVFDDSSAPAAQRPPPRRHSLSFHQNRTHYSDDPSNESLTRSRRHNMRAGACLVVLLRKEVIQPHLPVRLPCYDFVPIADPTFDGSLPQGLGHRLRVLPTFMT